MKRLLVEDLEHILKHTQSLWDEVRGKRIFITGGTGFFGKWLLESFIYINEVLKLESSITVLSRNPEKFLAEFPFYAEYKNVSFLKGNVIDFEFPKEQYHFIIHAATEVDVKLNTEEPLLMLDTITKGTRRVLDFAKEQQVESFLLTSSGAVYGKQPYNVTHIKETDSFFIDINNPHSAYAEGKRLAELYCSIYNKQFGIPVKIARCFAFVGPYLPLDSHFAVGNFIKDVLNGGPLIIKGDGNSYRSYLYTSDLMVWLWTILFKGVQNRPYNVGSSSDMKISEIASRVASLSGERLEIKLSNENKYLLETNRYIPSVDRAQKELGLVQSVDLNDAISRTLLWNKSIRQNSTESRKLI